MASTSDVKQTPSSQPRELPPAYDAPMAQPSLLPTQPSSQQIPAPLVFMSPVPQNPNYDGPEDFLGLVIITTMKLIHTYIRMRLKVVPSVICLFLRLAN
ncbi:hypothetical protein EMCRGX_G018563 [Ephydatia muelleri]